MSPALVQSGSRKATIPSRCRLTPPRVRRGHVPLNGSKWSEAVAVQANGGELRLLFSCGFCGSPGINQGSSGRVDVFLRPTHAQTDLQY